MRQAGSVPSGDERADSGGRRGLTVVAVLVLAAAVAGWWGLVQRPRGAAVGAAVDLAAAVKSGRQLLGAGDLKGAYKAVSVAARQDPRHAAARELLGDVLLESRAQKEALEEYVAALASAERGELHVKIGNLCLALDLPEPAARHLQRALELEPKAEWSAAVREELAKLAPPPESAPAHPSDPGP